MDDKQEATIKRLARISRIVTLAYLGLAAVGVLLTRAAAAWVVTLGSVLLGLAALAFCASWLLPGILVLRRTPWNALAWLEGANPFVRTQRRWEDLSQWSRVVVYLVSLLLGGFMLALIINVAAAVLH